MFFACVLRSRWQALGCIRLATAAFSGLCPQHCKRASAPALPPGLHACVAPASDALPNHRARTPAALCNPFASIAYSAMPRSRLSLSILFPPLVLRMSRGHSGCPEVIGCSPRVIFHHCSDVPRSLMSLSGCVCHPCATRPQAPGCTLRGASDIGDTAQLCNEHALSFRVLKRRSGTVVVSRRFRIMRKTRVRCGLLHWTGVLCTGRAIGQSRHHGFCAAHYWHSE